MKLLLVEKNKLALATLEALIRKFFPDSNLSCILPNAFELKEILSLEHEFDLILSEVELVEGHSFSAFEESGSTTPVIFISESEQFAFQSFEYHCLDYLIKPIELKRLERAFEKYSRFSGSQGSLKFSNGTSREFPKITDQKKFKKRFLYRSGNRLCFVGANSVAYFYAEEGVTFLIEYPSGQKHIVDHSLSELENEHLDPSKFYRINRSTIINVDFLTEMRPYGNGRLAVSLQVKSDEPLIVAREKVSGFKLWINQ